MAKELAETQRPKKEAFLAAYAKTCNITLACKSAGCDRSSHSYWMNNDPEYPARFKQANEEAIDALEAHAVKRATQGIEKPVYHNGKIVGHTAVMSDTLLIFLLKGARPEKYRERYDMTGGVDHKHEHQHLHITNKEIQVALDNMTEEELLVLANMQDKIEAQSEPTPVQKK